jgi:hypothetical protein
MHCVKCPEIADETMDPPPIDVGVGGGSASREYDRRMAKRDAEARAKWGDRFGGFMLAVTSEPSTTRAWAIGARGEEKLAASLAEVDGLQVLNDRRVPGTRGNIDHIVIAPAGVFVVDAKNHRGRIEIRNRGPFLRPDYRLYVGGRDCSGLADGLGWQVDAVRSALESSGPNVMACVTPALCFISAEWPLLSPPDSYRGVRLESVRSLRKLLVERDELDAPTIDRLTRVLAAALPSK